MKIKSTLGTKRKNQGFTLIELIVTVSIVAIFASIAVPSFTEIVKRNRISVTTNEFMSNLVLARSEALKRSRTVTLCASANQTSCSGSTDFSKGWIVYADCDGDSALTSTPVDCNGDGVNESEVIKVNDGYENLLIDGNANSEISFNFSGRVAGPAKRIEIGHDDGSAALKDVVINRVGRIRSQDH